MTAFSWATWNRPGARRVAPSYAVGDATLENVLVGIIWRLDATDGSHSVFESGEVVLDPPDPENFQNLDAISAEELGEWAIARIDVDAVKARLTAELEKLTAPATVLV